MINRKILQKRENRTKSQPQQTFDEVAIETIDYENMRTKRTHNHNRPFTRSLALTFRDINFRGRVLNLHNRGRRMKDIVG